MNVLEWKALEVASCMHDDSKYPVDGVVAFDPATLLTVVSIFLSALHLWRGCNQPTVALHGLLQAEAMVTQTNIARIVRQKAKEKPVFERRDFRKSVMNAIRSVGRNVSLQELEEMIAEADRQV